MEDSFIVVIGQERIEVSKRVAEVSEYISNILFIGQGQEEIEIDANIISKQTFTEFLKFCEINDYSEPEVVRPIRTNILRDVVDKKNYEFIKEYSVKGQNTYNLLSAAQFLVCKGLRKLIAALFACELYFQDSVDSYLKKKQEIGVTQYISFEDQQRYKKDFISSNESS